MQLRLEEMTEGVLNVSLIGRLDTPGVDAVETRLTAHLVPRGARAMIDLSQVTFIGSGGIRMFITIARALGRKGGKLVLYGAHRHDLVQRGGVKYLGDERLRADATAAATVVRV